MLNTIVTTFNQVIDSFQANLSLLLMLTLILWGIHVLNMLSGYRLNAFGILPRTAPGLIGIPLSPLLHGSVAHLFFNTIPFFVLSALILVNGKTLFFDVSIIIIVLGGAAVWLFGRRAMHVGASGVIMGYWGFLLLHAYQQRSFVAILLALLCLYYFSGLIFSLFPREKRVSWEGHVFGFLAGLCASYLITHHHSLVTRWLH